MPRTGIQGKRISARIPKAERIRRVAQMSAEGWSASAIAREFGVNPRTIKSDRREALSLPPDLAPITYPQDPVNLADITDPEIQACLVDDPVGYEAFFNKFSPHILQPHSRKLIEGWWDPEKGEWKEQILENVPPRHAKSECAIWFVIWRICLDRSVRVILVSKAHTLAGQFTSFIAYQLEHNIDLLKVFGRFRPFDQEGIWRANQGELDVAGKDPGIKERTLRARGSGEQIYGLAADWIICDDVVTSVNTSTLDQRDKLDIWFHQECLSRLEPEGHCVVIGTRFHRDDLYGRLGTKRYADPDFDLDEMPLWEWLVFPALYDPITGDASIGPDCVALWPDRWSRSKLLRTRANSPSISVFSATYQQDPSTDDFRLTNSEQFYGSGEWPGCTDDDRETGQAPWPREDVIRCISIDPSPTKYAAAILADLKPGEVFNCAVLNIERRRMDVPQMKTLIDEWNQDYGPIDYLVFEANAFARWFVMDEEIQGWAKDRGIRVIPHFTHARNKQDPVQGFSAMSGDFEKGRIRFPYSGVNARMMTKAFADEAIGWTGPKDLQDQLMSLWFLKAQYRNLSGYLSAVGQSIIKGFSMPPRMTTRRWIRTKEPA